MAVEVTVEVGVVMAVAKVAASGTETETAGRTDPRTANLNPSTNNLRRTATAITRQFRPIRLTNHGPVGVVAISHSRTTTIRGISIMTSPLLLFLLLPLHAVAVVLPEVVTAAAEGITMVPRLKVV